MACIDCMFRELDLDLMLVHCVLFDEIVSLGNECFMDSSKRVEEN